MRYLSRRRYQASIRRPGFEPLESRALLTTVALESVSEINPASITLKYAISGGALATPVNIGIYRSPDGEFNATALRSTDETIASVSLSGSDTNGQNALAIGDHTKTINLPTQLGIDPEHPFVYAVIDPASQELNSRDLASRSDFFHKYVLGIVTHGFVFTLVQGNGTMPAWVSQMAADLQQVDHYQKAIAFDWASLASLDQPGETAIAARMMVSQIDAAVAALATNPTDVVDLHLIGHSRGTVVIGQALQDLFDTPGEAPAALAAGYTKATLLDPHPAQPTLDGPNGQPIAQWYSIGTTPLLNTAAVNQLESVEAAINDPPVVIPPNVSQVQVYYQHTASSELAGTSAATNEPTLFNLWGQVPVDAVNASYFDLTGSGIGHEEVHDWYLNNVVLTDSLNAAGPNPGVHVSPGNANAAYVEQVFQDVLQRPADDSGLTYWVTQLNNGTPRSTVAAAIDHSAEYDATNVITPGYLKFLSRGPDPSGLTYWTGRLQAGMTDQQFDAQLAASAEFYGRSGGTNATWIDAIYQAFLGRGSDQQGQTYWLAQLAAGETRVDVASSFTVSDEGLRQQVIDDYMQFLGRAPDPSGLAYWLGQFQQGATNEDVLTRFVSSDEYFQQHTGQSG